LYQALETERGGVKIYETALTCAQNEDLTDEWEEYLEQTRTHVQVLLKVCEELGLNPDTVTPGREVVAHITRELWIESLGLPAVLPPPEERKKVETAIGAARAENLRDDMLRSKH
jgi:rubrerythrin